MVNILDGLAICIGLANIASALQLPFQTSATSPKSLIPPETHEWITSLLDRWNSSGLSIAVVRKDDALPTGWETDFGSYGVATGDGEPVTPDTLFAIASNSKLFLSLSVGLVLGNDSLGKNLNWKSKARDVFKGTDLWGVMDDEMERGISVQDMLSHRTGLPRHDYSGQPRDGGVAEMISKLRYLKLSAEFREIFQYNNLMYETLSHLPPLFLNQTYESYVAEHLFTPLNMSSSTYSVAEAEEWGTLADGFMSHLRDEKNHENGTLRATVPYFLRPGNEFIWSGAGGVLTSARDLTKWVSMLLNDGRHPYTNKTVIPSEIVDRVATGVMVSNGKAAFPELSPRVYGCGQWRSTYRGHELIEHGGHNPGYHTQVARFPNDNLGVIVLSNDENAYRIIDIVKWKLVDGLLGFKDSIDWESRYRKEEADELLKRQASVVHPPALTQTPSISFDDMQGTYTNPAYGTFDACYTNATTPSPSCKSLVSHPTIKQVLSLPSFSRPALVFPFVKFFTTYIVLQHFDGNTFNASMVWNNYDVRKAEGYDDEEGVLITGLDDRYEVEYVVDHGDEGWAFRGNFWGAGEGADKYKDKRGEVWFGKSL